MISIATAWNIAGPSRLELYNAESVLLAVGRDQGVSNVIADYPVPVDGTYFVRLERVDVSNYTLVVTRGAGLDTSADESLGATVPMSNTGFVLGRLGNAFPVGSGDGGQAAPLPLQLTDGEGFPWSILPDGYLGSTASGAYDFGLYIPTPTSFPGATLEQDGREVVLGPSSLTENLTLSRKVFVSPSEGFARFLDIYTNTGATPVTWSHQLFSNLGSDNVTQIVATSSGDDSLDEFDYWLVTDDADGRNDPPLTHVFAGSAALGPTSAELSADEITLGYQLELAPGETQIVMHFAAQSTDRPTAEQKATALGALSLGALQGMSLEEISQVVNFEPPDILDSYSLELQAGVEIELTTTTPSDVDDLRAGDVIDPVLRLFDASGTLVAEDDNSAIDGRNARLVWTPTVDGTYVVQVSSVAGAGPYGLRSRAVNLPSLSVITTDPPVGRPVPALPTSWVLNFSSAVDLASVQASDLLINGQSASAVEVVDGDSLRFTVDEDQLAGAESITLAMSADAVRSYAGTANQAFAESYLVDSAAPRVISTSWNGLAFPVTRLLSAGRIRVGIEFDESIRSENLDPDDVRVLDNQSQEFIPAQDLAYDDDSHTVFALFFLPEGDYTLVVTSTDGALEDIAGNDLDGDSADGIVPSGDGLAGGNYSLPFRIDEQTIDVSSRFVELKPAGSRVGQAIVTDTISYGEDVDTYQLTLSRGERLAANVVRADPNLESAMTVEVRDPWGRIVATAHDWRRWATGTDCGCHRRC